MEPLRLEIVMVRPANLTRVYAAVRLATAAHLIPTPLFRKEVRFAGHAGTTHIPDRLQQHPCGSGYGVRIVDVLLRFSGQHFRRRLHLHHHHIYFQFRTAQFTLCPLLRLSTNTRTAVKILNARDGFQHYRRHQNNQ